LGALEPGPGRDEEVEPPDAGPFTLPNALTALRLVLAPVFLALYVRGELSRALVVFGVAASTDMVDGLAARLLGQHSRLGEFLDPIADKLLAFCALIALTTAGRLPLWIIGMLVGRDAAQLCGALLLTALGRSVPMHPTRAGKYATFAVASLVVGELLVDAGAAGLAAAQPWLAAVALLAAACVLVSLVQYGRIFARVLRAAPAPTHGR